jgi:hypothetical protein
MIGEPYGSRTHLASLKGSRPHPKSNGSYGADSEPRTRGLDAGGVALFHLSYVCLVHLLPCPARNQAALSEDMAARLAGRQQTVNHIQIVKDQSAFPGRYAGAVTAKSWCPTRDLNSEKPVSKTGAYACSASGAEKLFDQSTPTHRKHQKKKARRPCGASRLVAALRLMRTYILNLSQIAHALRSNP